MTFAHIPHSDRLLVVVGPSGAGKDSVLRAWLPRTGGALHLARRVITRSADAHENHESTTGSGFEALLAANQLATWWRAHGLSYGVRHGEFAPLAHGRWVVMNGSREHLPRLRSQAPGLRCIEITAPPEVLHTRITARAREGTAAATARLSRRVTVQADLTLNNDRPLETTVEALQQWWIRQQGGERRR